MPARSRPSSLRTFLLGRTMMVGLAPLVVLAAVSMLGLQSLSAAAGEALATSRRAEADRATTELRSRAETAGREIDLIVGSTLDKVVGLARHPVVVGGAQAATGEANALLAAELEGSPELVSIGFTDSSGHYAGWAGGGTAVPRGARAAESWWSGAWSSGAHITGVTVDQSSGRSAVVVASRISGSQGEPVGVLQASLALDAIQAVTESHRSGGTEVEVVAAGAEAGLGGGGWIRTSARIEWDRARGPAGAPLAPPEWLVVAWQPSKVGPEPPGALEVLSDDVSDARAELLLVVIAVVLFGAFVAAATTNAVARQIVDPLRRLSEQARRSAGTGAAPGIWFDPGAGIEVDEVQELARSLGAARRTAAERIEARSRPPGDGARRVAANLDVADELLGPAGQVAAVVAPGLVDLTPSRTTPTIGRG